MAPKKSDRGTMVALEVAGEQDAVIAIPFQGSAPHQVVIAAHANWDRPSWECDWWRHVFPKAFILCPRGLLRDDSEPGDPRFTYVSDVTLEIEAAAGLEALKRRFGERVDSRSIIWTGLSRGAFLGAEVAPRSPQKYVRLILVEGGHDPWNYANTKAFAEGGGQRVLFICGQGACGFAARKAKRMLDHFGVASRIEMVEGMGHGLNNDAAPVVAGALPWLMASAD